LKIISREDAENQQLNLALEIVSVADAVIFWSAVTCHRFLFNFIRGVRESATPIEKESSAETEHSKNDKR
jgi:hypothetical protein